MTSKELNETSTSSSVYNREYFTTCCDGYEQFSITSGQALPPRLQIPFELANVQPSMQIVDLGCGRGEIVLHCVRKGADVWGLDYAWDALSLAQENLRRLAQPPELARWGVLQTNARQLPFCDSSMDLVFMLDIVEHLYPRELADTLREVLRILRPGGRLIVHTMPNLLYYRYGYPVYRGLQRIRGQLLPSNPRARWAFQHVHVNEQTPISLSKAMQASGFRVVVWLRSTQDYNYEQNRYIRWGMKFLTRVYPFRWIFCNDIFAIGTKEL
jgi:ubiquinone/menaquinone biosynthesis C-methylase UbiE